MCPSAVIIDGLGRSRGGGWGVGCGKESKRRGKCICPCIIWRVKVEAKVKSLGCAELRSWKWKGTVTGDEEGDLVAEEVGRGRHIAGNTCWAARNIVGRRTGEWRS